MATRSPRPRKRWPRLEAVRPLPSEEATPPVTKMCRVAEEVVCTTDFDGISRRPRSGAQVTRRAARSLLSGAGGAGQAAVERDDLAKLSAALGRGAGRCRAAGLPARTAAPAAPP